MPSTVDSDKFSITRDEIIQKINDNNIFCQIGSCGEIYKENALKEYAPSKELSNAKELFETALLLKCDPTITEEKALKNISKIKEILCKYNKNWIIKNLL